MSQDDCLSSNGKLAIPCVEHYSQLQVLDQRVARVEEDLKALDPIRDTLHNIEISIATQSTTLPRIEKQMAELASRVSSEEKSTVQTHIEHAGAKAKSGVQDKVTWSLLTGIFLALLTLVATQLIG